MTVAKFIQPDRTTQDGITYPFNIDAAIAVLAEVSSNFAAHEAATPDMTVVIDAGKIAKSGTFTNKTQQTTTTITAPTANPRIDRIAIDTDTGDYVIITGAEAASPVAPDYSSNHYPVCQFTLQTTTTEITDSLIIDERSLVQGSQGVPVPTTGDGNKVLQVNSTEDGYDLRQFIEFYDTTNTVNLINSLLSICKMNVSANRFVYAQGSEREGDVVIIYKTTNNANTITFSSGGAQTVEGGSSYVISAPNSMHMFVLDSTNDWVLVERTGNFGTLLTISANITTIATASTYTIPFDSELRDVLDTHNNVTNNTRITIPTGVTKAKLKGKIRALYSAFSENFYTIRAIIYKNNSSVYDGRGWLQKEVYMQATSFDYFYEVETAELDVVAGDYFELRIYHNTGADATIYADYVQFELEILG